MNPLAKLGPIVVLSGAMPLRAFRSSEALSRRIRRRKSADPFHGWSLAKLWKKMVIPLLSARPLQQALCLGIHERRGPLKRFTFSNPPDRKYGPRNLQPPPALRSSPGKQRQVILVNEQAHTRRRFVLAWQSLPPAGPARPRACRLPADPLDPRHWWRTNHVGSLDGSAEFSWDSLRLPVWAALPASSKLGMTL